MTLLRWRKATASGQGGGDCVEIAEDGANVLIRDSKYQRDPARSLQDEPILTVSRDTWIKFIASVVSNEPNTSRLIVTVQTDGSACLEILGDEAGAALHYTASEWLAFLDGAQKGEFDTGDQLARFTATGTSTTEVSASTEFLAAAHGEELQLLS